MFKQNTINQLYENLDEDKLKKGLYKEYAENVKKSVNLNDLEFWGTNIYKIIDKFIPVLMNCKKDNKKGFMELFEKQGIKNKKQLEKLEGPYQEFKEIIIKPMLYGGALIEKRLKNAALKNKNKNIKNKCECGNYVISKDMTRPYVVDNKDTVYSILPPEHTSNACLMGREMKGIFQICPNFTRERECILISGPSGSGKTFLAKEYLRKYNKIFPNNDIILFANKEFEKFNIPYHKFVLKEKMDLRVNDYRDSILIFDDVENIHSNKNIQEEVISFLEEVLNVGRSMHISVVIMSHVLMNYRFSRNMIMECNKIIMFPNSGIKFQYENFLSKYIGLSKIQIGNAMDTRSRWLCIDKESPISIITDREFKII